MQNYCKDGKCTAKTMAEYCKCKFQSGFHVWKWCAMETIEGQCTNEAAQENEK